MAIKHLFFSPKADDADTTLVRPSNWNADHTIEDNTITMAKLTFTPAQLTDITDAINAHNAASDPHSQYLLASEAVTSIRKAGAALLVGAVTLTGGSNITLTQVGQDISISTPGGSVPDPLSIGKIIFSIGADVAVNRQTLSGTLTLTTSSKRYQNLDLNGASRNVDLPAVAEGLAFFIVNASSGTEVLTVRTSGAATIQTLNKNEGLSVISDGTVWISAKATVVIV